MGARPFRDVLHILIALLELVSVVIQCGSDERGGSGYYKGVFVLPVFIQSSALWEVPEEISDELPLFFCD